MTAYHVWVNDNWHYTHEEERYLLGSFTTAEEAIATCQGLVDRFLAGSLASSRTAEELYDRYVLAGPDPFIRVDGGEPVDFSAWDYAKARSKDLTR